VPLLILENNFLDLVLVTKLINEDQCGLELLTGLTHRRLDPQVHDNLGSCSWQNGIVAKNSSLGVFDDNMAFCVGARNAGPKNAQFVVSYVCYVPLTYHLHDGIIPTCAHMPPDPPRLRHNSHRVTRYKHN